MFWSCSIPNNIRPVVNDNQFYIPTNFTFYMAYHSWVWKPLLSINARLIRVKLKT